MKRPVELVEAAFEAAGYPLTNGRTACFVHGGDNPTALSVFEVDGEARVKCQTRDCKAEDIWRSVGLWLEVKAAPAGTKSYEARKDGVIVAKHIRKDGGTKGDKHEWWEPGISSKGLDLYQSWSLNGSGKVVIVEGERATDALKALGIDAVGTYGATIEPTDEALAVLKGREIYTWADADDVGRSAMYKIAKRLGKVRMISTEGLPKGFDAADASPVVVKHLIATAQPFEAPRITAVTFRELPTDPPPALVLGRLHPTGHTILYGRGGAGKGSLAMSWAIKLVREGKRVLVCDYENLPEEWGQRSHSLGLTDSELDSLVYVAPHSREWKGKHGPIWEAKDDIAGLIEDYGIDHVVVDSVAYACAGIDPSKPEAPQFYSTALQYFGKPTLSLAHVNRAGDASMPFGSVFWHNGARITWNLEKIGDERKLTMYKANNYEHVPAQRVTLDYSFGTLINVAESVYSETLLQTLTDLLAYMGEATAKDLRTELQKGIENDLEREAVATEATILNAFIRSKGQVVERKEGKTNVYSLADASRVLQKP